MKIGLVWRFQACKPLLGYYAASGEEVYATQQLNDALSILEGCDRIYTNDPVCQRLNPSQVRCLNLVPSQWHYWLSMGGHTQPDDCEFTDSVIERQPPDFTTLLTLLERFNSWHDKYTNMLEQTLPPPTAYQDTHSSSLRMGFLNRPLCRVYPNKAVMDRHVFATRWPGTHFQELTEHPLPLSAPVRDVALLRQVRMKKEVIYQVNGPCFFLIRFRKNCPVLDFPADVPSWISNVELYVLHQYHNIPDFEVEDVMRFQMPSDQIEKSTALSVHPLVKPGTVTLSVTAGMAYREALFFGPWKNTWLTAWLRSVERAQLLAIYGKAQTHFPMALSGYGDGMLSFYCWHGEVRRVADWLRERAAVIKQFDEDTDAEIRRYFLQPEERQSNEFTISADYHTGPRA